MSNVNEFHVGTNLHQSPDGKDLCSYSKKICKQRRMDGCGFCVKHILEDPTAPFHQCIAICSNNRQCTNAIHNSDTPNKGEIKYCANHLNKLGLKPTTKRKRKVPIKKSKGNSKTKLRLSEVLKAHGILKKSELRTYYELEKRREQSRNRNKEVNLDSDKTIVKKPEILSNKTLWESMANTQPVVSMDEPSLLSVEEQLQRRRVMIVRLANRYESEIHRIKVKVNLKGRQFVKDAERVNIVQKNQFVELPSHHKTKKSDKAKPKQDTSSGTSRKRRRRAGLAAGDITCSCEDCRGKVLPLTSFCFAHVLSDPRQVLYKGCEYVNPEGVKCNYPVLTAATPLICCGHVDLVAGAKRKRKKKDTENRGERKKKETEKSKGEKIKKLSEIKESHLVSSGGVPAGQGRGKGKGKGKGKGRGRGRGKGRGRGRGGTKRGRGRGAKGRKDIIVKGTTTIKGGGIPHGGTVVTSIPIGLSPFPSHGGLSTTTPTQVPIDERTSPSRHHSLQIRASIFDQTGGTGRPLITGGSLMAASLVAEGRGAVSQMYSLTPAGLQNTQTPHLPSLQHMGRGRGRGERARGRGGPTHLSGLQQWRAVHRDELGGVGRGHTDTNYYSTMPLSISPRISYLTSPLPPLTTVTGHVLSAPSLSTSTSPLSTKINKPTPSLRSTLIHTSTPGVGVTSSPGIEGVTTTILPPSSKTGIISSNRVLPPSRDGNEDVQKTPE